MAEGLGRRRWAHTSLICALLANANRDPKKGRVFKPSDFDPYAKETRRRRIADKLDLALLKEALEPARRQAGPGKSSERKGEQHGRERDS